MGIGTTVKNMLGNETEADHDSRMAKDRRSSDVSGSTPRSADTTNRLPAGTGPGTSGKADTSSTTDRRSGRDSELAHEQELARSGGSIEGYGTDAAAAAGGSLSASHQASGLAGRRTSKRSPNARDPSDQAAIGTALVNGPPQSNLTGVSEGREYSSRISDTSNGPLMHMPTPASAVAEPHQFGHSRINAKDVMPTPDAHEDTNQLKPVTHERVRHLETEEVSRIMDHERHIHHVQHHMQPVVASEELATQIKEQLHPVTVVNERHANKLEDRTLLEGQVFKHHDTLTHLPKERTVIDKGTVVNEHVHHHVHHIIQPVIEKETIERQVIHTTVPIHEITHEAPVVHQSQKHAPVPLEHFLSRGGSLSGAFSQDEITKKALTSGDCAREVKGIAEKLEEDLNLGKSSAHLHSLSQQEPSRPVAVASSRN